MGALACAVLATFAAWLVPLFGAFGFALGAWIGLVIGAGVFGGGGLFLMWYTGHPGARLCTCVAMVLAGLAGFDYIN